MGNEERIKARLDEQRARTARSVEQYKNTVRLFRGAAVKLVEQKLETAANKRAAYALGAELGIKPGEIDTIIAMARSEIGPNDLGALAKESGAEAAAKGKPYVGKVLEYKEG